MSKIIKRAMNIVSSKVLCILFLISFAQLNAAIHIVTSSADSGPGSLREALSLAQPPLVPVAGEEDEIKIMVNEINVMNPLNVNFDLRIYSGVGFTNIINHGRGRVMNISNPLGGYTDVRLTNIGIMNGAPSSHGAIFASWSKLYLDNCVFSENNEGGINLNRSFLYAKNSRFEDNYTQSFGGAIYGYKSTVDLKEGVVFLRNRANKRGGAINLTDCPSLSATGVTFEDNFGRDEGGAICVWYDCGVNINGSKFIGNSSNGFGGGIAISPLAYLNAINVTFDGNTANEGGAVAQKGTYYSSNLNFPKTLKFLKTVFLNNSSTARGGAIFTDHHKLDLRKCSVVKNQTGTNYVIHGAWDNINGYDPDLIMVNTTIAENHANGAHPGVRGIIIRMGYITYYNNTWSGNNPSHAHFRSNDVIVARSILNAPSTDHIIFSNGSSNGYSCINGLVASATTGFIYNATDFINQNPTFTTTNLIHDKGTFYYEPDQSSGLIDAIPNVNNPLDQLGNPRGPLCDVGAIEVQMNNSSASAARIATSQKLEKSVILEREAQN